MLHRAAGTAALEGRTLYGVAVPYNRTAVVNDGAGSYKERFLPGAFERSIRERGHKILLLANHDARSFPIGRAVDLAEQPDGLHASFEVADTRAGDDALALVRDGIVAGFSVGFRPIRSHRTPDGVTERDEAALMEVSLTAFPSYEDATVAGVRSLSLNISTEVAKRRLSLILIGSK